MEVTLRIGCDNPTSQRQEFNKSALKSLAVSIMRQKVGNDRLLQSMLPTTIVNF